MIFSSKASASLLSCTFFLLVLSGAVNASNFRFSKYLEIGTTITDNAELEQSNSDFEFVGNIKPSIELKFSGNRVAAILVTELEYFRFQESRGEIIDPRLFARSRGTVVDDFLYFDTSITYSKLAPDSSFLRLSQDSDPVMRLKNRLFVDKNLDEVADLYFAYGHSSFYPDIGEKAGSRQNGLEFWLGKDPKYGGLIWSVGANYDLDESESNQFENATVSGSLGWALSETLLVSITSGVEDRKYVSALDTVNSVTTEDENSSLWDAGVTWSPAARTKLSVGYGERFFGGGPRLKFDHRNENSLFTARFSRDITRTAPSLADISSLTSDTSNAPITDTDSITVGANIAAELAEPFIDNNFRVSYKLTGRRSDLIFDGVYSVQDQLDGDEQIKSWLGRLVFDRRLSERAQIRFQYEHQKSEAAERPNKNYSENRFVVKFLFNFDRVESSRNEEFSE